MDHWQQAQIAGHELHRDNYNRYLTMGDMLNRGPPPPSSSSSESYPTHFGPPTSHTGQHTLQEPSAFETQQRRNALSGTPYDDRYYDRYMTHPQTRGWESSSKSHFMYLYCFILFLEFPSSNTKYVSSRLCQVHVDKIVSLSSPFTYI
jgi:hypothetical protein